MALKQIKSFNNITNEFAEETRKYVLIPFTAQQREQSNNMTTCKNMLIKVFSFFVNVSNYF